MKLLKKMKKFILLHHTQKENQTLHYKTQKKKIFNKI